MATPGKTAGRRPLLWVEWSVIYVAIPVTAYFEILPFSKILVFVPAVLYSFAVFRFAMDGSPPSRGHSGHPWRWLAMRVIAAVPVLGALTWLVEPAWLFQFPTEHPVLWMAVMAFYPFLSALPQEFLYRRFYFLRYGMLFQSETGRILSSSLAFAFLHVIYGNGVAPALSLAGGLVFSHAYSRTGRLLYPWVEHTIYGWIIFTVGLGRYFYEPLFR